MAPVVRGWEGAFEILSTALVTAVLDFLGNVGVDAVQNPHVQDVPGDEPGDHKDAKCDVASEFKMEILQNLGQRKDDVDGVHQTKDEVADPILMVTIGRKYKGTGDDMVGEHLHVVLPPLLNVDDDNLLEPETELDQIVPLGETGHLASRPVPPQSSEVEPVVGVVHEKHAGAPRDTGVDQKPGLFREAHFCLFLFDPRQRRQRSQNIVHDDAAETRKHNDPVEDEKYIVPAESEGSCCRVEIGDAKEFLGVVSGGRGKDVYKEEHGDEVYGYACEQMSVHALC